MITDLPLEGDGRGCDLDLPLEGDGRGGHPAERRLILFDVDCTLLRTAGAGMAALQSALSQVLGRTSVNSQVLPDGQTDPKIVRAMLAENGFEAASRELVWQVLDAYPPFLEMELQSRRGRSRLEPGVLVLLQALHSLPNISLGVLTGNIRVAARLKLELFELHNFFLIGAYACDHEERTALGPLALHKARQTIGHDFEASQVWLIGDTPRDIEAARALTGSRVLAVATGHYSVESLASHRPDQVVEDLSDTARVLQLLLS